MARGASGSFVDYGPADQGALFDLRLPNMSTFASTATLYYGAGADAADAGAALAAVGARTFAVAKPSTSLPPTGAPNSFVFGYKPAS